MKAYAAYYDNPVRYESSSGGVFSVIASLFDVVYGVAMTKDCYEAEYIREEKDISRIRGSKYIQAKVGDAFKNVKCDLEMGKRVLFSGTGCQINGLKCFLRKDYPNLFLLDVICHGVPSPKLWRKYIESKEKKYGKLEFVNFRSKIIDWRNLRIKTNKIYISKDEDPYMRLFLDNYSLRPSCYECHAKYYKCSDMTIADFWGIVSVAPNINDGMGTSLIITRTNKGDKLFHEVKNRLKWQAVSYEDAIRENPSEYCSASMPVDRNLFFSDMNNLTFAQLKKKYVRKKRDSFSITVKRSIKKNLIKYLKWGRRSNSDYGMFFIFKKK